MSVNENDNNSNNALSIIASVGAILLFALIIWLTYIPTRSVQVDVLTRTKQEQKLVETKAKAAKSLNNYAIVSSADGIYRIPIDVAMEKTVETYQQ